MADRPDQPGPDRIAVVVVDHGSRRAEAARYHEAFVESWRARHPDLVVEAAHLELVEPSIDTAFDRCVAAGATLVVLAPYFLWPGNHWDRDIPALAAAAAARHPGVRHLVTAPLGPHRLLGDIVDDRVATCLAHATGGGAACELCADGGGCRLR